MARKPTLTPLRATAVIVLGAVAMAAGAQVSVPMVPVPTTLQTLVVVLLGLLAGPRLAMGAAALYLLLAIAGLPVLSSFQRHGGWAFVEFLAAGYVVGFIPAAGVAGWLGRTGGFLRLAAAGLAGHAVVLAFGVPVIAYWVDWPTAIERGLTPFLIGAAAKSLVAAGIAVFIRRA
jgi:biotin transport system substrate-specific component